MCNVCLSGSNTVKLTYSEAPLLKGLRHGDFADFWS